MFYYKIQRSGGRKESRPTSPVDLVQRMRSHALGERFHMRSEYGGRVAGLLDPRREDDEASADCAARSVELVRLHHDVNRRRLCRRSRRLLLVVLRLHPLRLVLTLDDGERRASEHVPHAHDAVAELDVGQRKGGKGSQWQMRRTKASSAPSAENPSFMELLEMPLNLP